jgi:hypothetical protein
MNVEFNPFMETVIFTGIWAYVISIILAFEPER